MRQPHVGELFCDLLHDFPAAVAFGLVAEEELTVDLVDEDEDEGGGLGEDPVVVPSPALVRPLLEGDPPLWPGGLR